MVEQVYPLAKGNDKTVEKLIFDENVQYVHMILGEGDFIPEHHANSTVYMTVVRGTLSIGLDDQEIHKYEASTVLKIPYNTKMNVRNNDKETVELLVVKAPAPKM